MPFDFTPREEAFDPIEGLGVADVYMDFETFSEISVKDVGAWKYSQHPSTEVLCLCYQFDQETQMRVWVRGDPPPLDLITAIEGGALVHAHNAVFEFAILTNVAKWCHVDYSQMRCTLALCAFFSYPLGLEKAGEAIEADTLKDKEGKRLLKKFSTPRKPSKNNPKTRFEPEDDPENFRNLVLYCAKDVVAERAILERLPRQKLSAYEQNVYELDFLMNMRGVKIDVETVKHIIGLAEEYAQVLEAEAMEITGGITTGKRAAILKWAEEDEGYLLESYTKDYIVETLKDPELPSNVRRVLEIRQILGKTSVSKYPKMLECAGWGDKARGMVQYCGAGRTGRFAGRLIQVHNLPRGNYKKVEQIAPIAKYLTLDDFLALFDDVYEAFSSLIRSMIVADDGWELFVSDFSNIEGRVLVWMAGQKDVMLQFKRGDDVYKHMAATIFGVTYGDVDGDQRFVGKQAVLGCGYGMGGPKFLDTCIGYGRDIGLELAQKTVKTYRKKNHKVVKMWYAVEAAAKEAILSPGTRTVSNMCEFEHDGKNLYIRLPSRRVLTYVDARVKDRRIEYKGIRHWNNTWGWIDTYGGKLVENIVQAVARDLLVAGMINCENAGYNMLTTIHDELVATAKCGTGKTLHEFELNMKTPPAWAGDCPIDVEGWVGTRYKKG